MPMNMALPPKINKPISPRICYTTIRDKDKEHRCVLYPFYLV